MIASAVAVAAVILASPAGSEEWRLVEFGEDFGVFGALNVSNITGPPSRRSTQIVMWNRPIGGERYGVGTFAIDCVARQIHFGHITLFDQAGEAIEGSADVDARAGPVPLHALPPAVVAKVCDDVAITSTEFGSAHEFFEWVVAEHGLAQRLPTE